MNSFNFRIEQAANESTPAASSSKVQKGKFEFADFRLSGSPASRVVVPPRAGEQAGRGNKPPYRGHFGAGHTSRRDICADLDRLEEEGEGGSEGGSEERGEGSERGGGRGEGVAPGCSSEVFFSSSRCSAAPRPKRQRIPPAQQLVEQSTLLQEERLPRTG